MRDERGDVALASGKQRALLALLVLGRGRPVPVDALVEELWDGAPPPGAAKTLQVYVSRLRTALGDAAVERVGAGYALAAGGRLDADRFEQLVEVAQQEEPDPAAARLREALALWRGRALEEFDDRPWARVEAGRLEELRLHALELRIDADLRRGLAAELVPELESLVAAEPLRERLCGQLMLALYRSGRQADALELYRATRRRLVDELGLEPGPELQELQRAILAQDPVLRPLRATAARRRRRGGILVAVGGAVLLLAAAAVAGELVRSSPPTHLAAAAPDSVAVIDPHSNSLRADVPIGSGPTGVALAGNAVWVANAGDQTLAELTRGAQLVARVGLGRIPSVIAAQGPHVWVASPTGRRGDVVRVDGRSARVVGSSTVRVGFGTGEDFFAPATPSAVAADDGGVWTNALHGRLLHIGVNGRTRAFTIAGARTIDGIAVAAGSVWLTSGADDSLFRLDERTGRVTRIAISARGRRATSPYGIVSGDGAVWVTDALADTVSRIDPRSGSVAATIRVGRRPTRIAVGAGGVWVVDAGDGAVTRIDPRTNRVVATIRVGSLPTGIAAGLGRVWVTVGGGEAASSAAAGHAPVTPVAGGACSPIVHGSGRPDVLITSDLPTYLGGDAPSRPIRDWRTAILAVLRASGFRAGRWRVAYQACNNSLPGGAVPERCAEDARAFALDPSVVGVIGPRESSCSEVELPTLNAAPGGPVAMVSSSNTYVGLTHDGPATAADEPDRYYPRGDRTYARLLGSDDVQAAGLVLFLHDLGRRRIFALHDGGPTGYAAAVYAARAARRLGMSVAGVAEWNGDASRYTALADRIARARADAVVLTGCICSNGARLMHDLRAALPRRTTFIGTDNFGSSDSFRHRVFAGMYSTSAGLSPHALPPVGRSFVERTFPHRSLDDLDFQAVYAAEATRILLRAIARSDGTRGSVAQQLLDVRDDGLVGPVAFDAAGDPVRTPVSIYRADPRLPYLPQPFGQGLAFVRSVVPPRALSR